MKCVLQDWVLEIPMMQQTVLITATRGPDGLTKYHPLKYLLRWYRRCFLKSSLDGLVLTDPWDRRGGSFTGPSVLVAEGLYESTGTLPPRMALDEDGAWEEMTKLVDKYIAGLDEIPHHFAMHFMHGVEILGYKHPTQHVRNFWLLTYGRLANDMHLHEETEAELDRRLGDTYEGWMERNDVATMS